MKRDKSATEDSNSQLWRGALIPAFVFSIICICASSIMAGAPGFFGSLLASFTVVIFFSVSLLVGKLTKSADPIATMALALFSYFTKLLLIAGFLLAVTKLTSEASVHRESFGISALVIAAAWLLGEVRAFFKLRLQLPLPETNSNSETNQNTGQSGKADQA